jgi:hypothetical protein
VYFGTRAAALLVDDKAILTDQYRKKFVYVLGAGDTA